MYLLRFLTHDYTMETWFNTLDYIIDEGAYEREISIVCFIRKKTFICPPQNKVNTKGAPEKVNTKDST